MVRPTSEGLPVIMAYTKETNWIEVALTAEEVKAIRAVITAAFKRAGGRGELPTATTLKEALKGRVKFGESAFQAGNVTPDDETAQLAKAWAEAIADGRGSLDDIAAWPSLHKMAAAMLRKAAPAPAPKAAPMPAPKAKGRKAA